MNSIIITIPKPKKNAHGDIGRWEDCVAKMRDKAEDSEDVEMLGQSAIWIVGENALGVFGSIVALVHEQNLRYEVLFVEKATRWKSEVD